MYTVLLAGGIGSGKSTVAAELERLGCHRIDLDRLSREVLEAGTPTTHAVAEAFGQDLLDPKTGQLDRALLAARAFASPETAALLERIELPAIRELLAACLAELSDGPDGAKVCLVEVPLLDRMGDTDSLADEVLVVSCPLALRRERAINRGMTGEDFDARASRQPTDEWLAAHATTIIDNSGTSDELLAQVRRWYAAREADGWR